MKECTKALELNPSYGKALLRRAEAQEKLENFEEAITGEFWILCFVSHLDYHAPSRMLVISLLSIHCPMTD